ncbi:sulfotransferase family protein [Streptosporangium sp. NPDC000396]|uniref:sulfotransferase family protein n=1 Tax=Streptosporangium sp. NPDC000396 TaxID=3366185 RepID=UPI0036C4C5CD
MLKVIGAGFPRTGTTSLKAALERLGFGPCHHMFEVLTRPEQVDRWLPVATGEPADWDQMFDGYRSAVDWPASYFWQRLAEAYPDAKVILTVRDPHRWYASFQTLISRTQGQNPPNPGGRSPEELPEALRAIMRFQPALEAMGKSTFGADWRFGQDPLDEEHAVQVFRRHVATVQDSLPADRLLVFEVGQGWGPLCDFLGVEPPADEPFPHLNDSESMRRNIARMMAGEEMISPFGSAP